MTFATLQTECAGTATSKCVPLHVANPVPLMNGALMTALPACCEMTLRCPLTLCTALLLVLEASNAALLAAIAALSPALSLLLLLTAGLSPLTARPPALSCFDVFDIE